MLAVACAQFCCGVLLDLHTACRKQWGTDAHCPTAADAKNRVLGFWTPYIATVLLIWSGEALTGPSMNPAYTFAWHFQMQVTSKLCMCLWMLERIIAGASFGFHS